MDISYGLPPGRPDHNIIEAVWDYQRTEQKAKIQKYPKKSFECSSGNLENYSCRLPKEMTRKLPARAQAVFKDKAGHINFPNFFRD